MFRNEIKQMFDYILVEKYNGREKKKFFFRAGFEPRILRSKGGEEGEEGHKLTHTASAAPCSPPD